MRASILELESGADGEVLDRARHKHFARIGFGENALSDVYGDPCEPVIEHFNLTRVQTGADLDAELTDRVSQNAGAPHCASGTVEGGEHTALIRDVQFGAGQQGGEPFGRRVGARMLVDVDHPRVTPASPQAAQIVPGSHLKYLLNRR